MTPPPPASLPASRIVRLLLVFALCVVVAHGAARWAQSVSPVPLGIGRWFPMSYGHPRTPEGWQVAWGVVTVGLFAGAVRFLDAVPSRFRHMGAALIGLLAILASTLTQGLGRGFVHPVAGREPHAKPAQYWHDAQRERVETGADALRFVRDFASVQPRLGEHGRTHPPGAVLWFALLRQATRHNAGAAAIVVCAVSVGLVAHGLRVSGASPGATLLFCATPAVQVYFCATLDALICGLLLVAVAAAMDAKRGAALPGTLALLAASFLTFGVVWAVPVLVCADLARTRRFPVRAALMLGAVVLCYVVLYAATGFDYLAALRFASHSENPHGFRLAVEPLAYLATRLENCADYLFFVSPLVLYAAWRGLPEARRGTFPAWAAFVAGAATLVALFLLGAYRTGETARACLFLTPLLVRVADEYPLDDRERETLVVTTFALGVALQLVGFYFW